MHGQHFDKYLELFKKDPAYCSSSIALPSRADMAESIGPSLVEAIGVLLKRTDEELLLRAVNGFFEHLWRANKSSCLRLMNAVNLLAQGTDPDMERAIEHFATSPTGLLCLSTGTGTEFRNNLRLITKEIFPKLSFMGPEGDK